MTGAVVRGSVLQDRAGTAPRAALVAGRAMMAWGRRDPGLPGHAGEGAAP